MKEVLGFVLVLGLLSTNVTHAGINPNVGAFLGVRSRIVWAQSPSGSNSGWDRKLIGYDTEKDTVCEITKYGTGVFDPILTHDGERIVCSEIGNKTIFVINWDGSGYETLGNGVAVDCWFDPADSVEWVYTMPDHIKNTGPVKRFQLDNPMVSETVWDQTEVSWSMFAVSPDGKWAAGNFPWPDFGLADLTTKTWTRFGIGCSPAICADGSNRVFHFQGTHRNITLFESSGDSIGVVDVHDAPGMKGWEVANPQWLKNPDFIVITGPYSDNDPGWCESDDCYDNINSGGTNVEIFLGRFNASFGEIEEWLQVTENDSGDFFPDVWMDLNDTITSSTVKPIRAVSNALLFTERAMVFDVVGRRILRDHVRIVQGHGQRFRLTKGNWKTKKSIVVR